MVAPLRKCIPAVALFCLAFGAGILLGRGGGALKGKDAASKNGHATGSGGSPSALLKRSAVREIGELARERKGQRHFDAELRHALRTVALSEIPAIPNSQCRRSRNYRPPCATRRRWTSHQNGSTAISKRRALGRARFEIRGDSGARSKPWTPAARRFLLLYKALREATLPRWSPPNHQLPAPRWRWG